MSSKPSLGALLLAASTSVIAPASAAVMRPGRWLLTMSAAVDGVPFAMPAVTAPVCLDADDAHWGVDRAEVDGKGSCRFLNRRVGDDGAVRYQMQCEDRSATSGEFEFLPSPDSVTGNGVVRTGSAVIRQQWSGERTGDC